MGVAQEAEELVGVRRPQVLAVAAYDDLQRDTADTGKGKHGIRYLTDAPPQLVYLAGALRTGYVQHHQTGERCGLVEAPLPEGGAEHQVRQPVGVFQRVARRPLLHG